MHKVPVCYLSQCIPYCTQKEVFLPVHFAVEPYECLDLPGILKPTEVAEFLCIHKNTVYKLIRRGDLPAFRVGKSWRIQRNDLFHLLDRSESE
ncbi:helix-turn-helix domain-containing protein [Bacteroides heparinolyticus]|uniref:helix-turn-helix domain-containing protein n=1 Tax=Prevotella heparinolytica TaxID=28113 RepID=UPI003C6BFDAC